MTVFGHSGGGFLAGKVYPVYYEAEVSQRLLEACLRGDLRSASDCISDPSVDVNFIGAVRLKERRTEVVLRDERASEARAEFHEFHTDVSPLFVAVHTGNVALVKKLLSAGADVNQKHFKGFAVTAAVKEGHIEISKILLKAGTSQPACEEALLEASCHGQAQLVKLLMDSDLIRPHISVHALVTACCRGFVDVVDTLMKCGVDADATARVLLRSSKPALLANVNCTSLVAAVASRQVSIVRLLLKASAGTDARVRLGAWSWDMGSGEEFRVGAGLAEPYATTWCAVEYFEASGAILRMLLQHHSPNTPHYGRTLLHHAILCGNAGAVKELLNCGAYVESPIKTTRKIEFRPIHLAARLGFSTILQTLTDFGCDLNSKTDSGETALMISVKHKQEECLRVLAAAGADFGLLNANGDSTNSIAASNQWSVEFQQGLLDAIRAGNIPRTSNVSVFCPILFVAQTGNVEALKVLIGRTEMNLNCQDDSGFSAVMIAALEGHIEAFRLLVYAGADVKLHNKFGDTAITIYKRSETCDLFEKIMLQFALEKGNRNAEWFYALHCAARRGDVSALMLLMNRGYDVNVPDGDGYTPLMLAAREGHRSICKLLISYRADCHVKTDRGETALSLARRSGHVDAENVILDELARRLVLRGADVWKHTKGGRGAPHRKQIIMEGVGGVLRWGKSSTRNVICQEAEVGPSARFKGRRRKKGDADNPGVFRVVTTRNKEVHFVSEGGVEGAELWVRGIMLVTREAAAAAVGCKQRGR